MAATAAKQKAATPKASGAKKKPAAAAPSKPAGPGALAAGGGVAGALAKTETSSGRLRRDGHEDTTYEGGRKLCSEGNRWGARADGRRDGEGGQGESGPGGSGSRETSRGASFS